MDPQTNLPDLVEDLEVNIDELTETLSPLLDTALSTTASSLPLLDKAKLYVLAAYSIESLLYSSLQASGANAKDHAIFRELGRLKGYFAKIKEIEERGTQPEQPKQKLDVGAAARFIKHGLAGNDRYDLERAERMAKEKARAHLKAAKINKKFNDDGEEVKESAMPKKRVAEEAGSSQDEQVVDDDDVIGGLEEPTNNTTLQPVVKRTKLSETEPMDIDSAPSPASSTSDPKKKRKKRGNQKTTKSTEASEEELEASQQAAADSNGAVTKQRKQRSRKGKKSADNTDAEAEAEVEAAEGSQETTIPARTRKSRSDGSAAHAENGVPEEKPKRGRGRPKKAK